MTFYCFAVVRYIRHGLSFPEVLELASRDIGDYQISGPWETSLGLKGQWRWFYSHDGIRLLGAVAKD